MDMFTSCGHIKKPKKITDLLMILAWACPFKGLRVIEVISYRGADYI